jgi:hypothetical protein
MPSNIKYKRQVIRLSKKTTNKFAIGSIARFIFTFLINTSFDIYTLLDEYIDWLIKSHGIIPAKIKNKYSKKSLFRIEENINAIEEIINIGFIRLQKKPK